MKFIMVGATEAIAAKSIARALWVGDAGICESGTQRGERQYKRYEQGDTPVLRLVGWRNLAGDYYLDGEMARNAWRQLVGTIPPVDWPKGAR